MTALDPAALSPDPRDLVRRAALEIHAGGDAAPLLAEIAALPADHPDRRLAAAFGRGLEIRRSGENPDAGNLYAPGPEEMLRAYEVLSGRTPFIRFGYVASNLAILSVAEPDRWLHVLDIGIGFGGQWLDLIRRLPGRAAGLLLTGVELPSPGADPEAQLRGVGERLAAAAAEAGVPFRFEPVARSIQEVLVGGFAFAEGAVGAVNAALALHHVADDDALPRDAALARIAALGPRVVALAEPEGDHTMPAFPERVDRAMWHYGAVFRALDALCPDDPRSREIIERMFFGREIVNVTAAEGRERVERHDLWSGWRERLIRAGLRPRDASGLLPAIAAGIALPPGASLAADREAIRVCWEGQAVINLIAAEV